MAITLVAHTAAGNSDTTGNNVTTSAIDTTGASLLVLIVSSFGGNPTVSDSKGNTWTGLTVRGTSGVRVRIYYAVNPTVGAGHTFSANSSALFPSVSVLAFAPADTSSPFDAENGATGSGGSVSTGSVTPGAGGEVVVAGVGWYPAGTVAIDGGFTIADQVDYAPVAAHIGVAGAYLIQVGAVAANPTWTHAGFTDAAAAVACFKTAGGGGGSAKAGAVYHSMLSGGW